VPRPNTTAREVLLMPSGGVSMSMRAWLADKKNTLAKEFLETWLDLRSKGESDWSAQRVYRYLRSTFGLPNRSEANFYAFLRAEYPKLAGKVILPR
jgi:hypothetical protein